MFQTEYAVANLTMTTILQIKKVCRITTQFYFFPWKKTNKQRKSGNYFPNLYSFLIWYDHFKLHHLMTIQTIMKANKLWYYKNFMLITTDKISDRFHM